MGHLSVGQSVCLFVCRIVCPSIRPSVRQSICNAFAKNECLFLTTDINRMTRGISQDPFTQTNTHTHIHTHKHAAKINESVEPQCQGIVKHPRTHSHAHRHTRTLPTISSKLRIRMKF